MRKSSREDDTLYVLNTDYEKKAKSGEQSELERDFVAFLFSPSQTSPAENLALAGLQLRRRLGFDLFFSSFQILFKRRKRSRPYTNANVAVR